MLKAGQFLVESSDKLQSYAHKKAAAYLIQKLLMHVANRRYMCYMLRPDSIEMALDQKEKIVTVCLTKLFIYYGYIFKFILLYNFMSDSFVLNYKIMYARLICFLITK